MIHSKPCVLGFCVLLLAPAARAALATQCWRIVHSQLTTYDGVPCGVVTSDSPVVPCCNVDTLCLSNGICQTPNENAVGFTGYYTAGCTDSSYNDPSCNPYCRDQFRADIVYSNVSQTWACCGTESDNTTVDCNSPTDELFDDPAPANLSTTFSVGSTATTGAATASSTSSSATTIQTTSSSSSAATSSPALSSQTGNSDTVISTGLSTGAKAGIGVGVAVVAIAVIAAGIFSLGKRQKNKMSPKPREMDGENGYYSKPALRELSEQPKRVELNAVPPQVVHEMSAETKSHV